jgi:hypothetical protein
VPPDGLHSGSGAIRTRSNPQPFSFWRRGTEWRGCREGGREPVGEWGKRARKKVSESSGLRDPVGL